MPKKINWKKLLKKNPGIDAKKLREWLEASQELYRPLHGRYRYNLVTPFAGRHRHPAAEIGGRTDNTRNRS